MNIKRLIKSKTGAALFLCLFSLILFSGFARAQSSCATAIPLDSTGRTNYSLSSNGNAWFTFIENGHSKFLLTGPNIPVMAGADLSLIDSVEIYSGTCTSLTLVAFYANTGSSPFFVTVPALASGTYYVRVHGTPCTNCPYGQFRLKPFSHATPQITGSCTGSEQCELICNGGFEILSTATPPNDAGQFDLTDCWNHFDTLYQGDPGPTCEYYNDVLWPCGTPDLFNVNAGPPNNFSVDIPNNAFGSSATMSNGGNAYAGFYTFWKEDNNLFPIFANYDSTNGRNAHEYLQQKLNEPMISGRTYRVTFSVRLAQISSVAAKIGCAFSNSVFRQDLGLANYQGNYNGVTQFQTPFITDTSQWTTFTFNYTATAPHTWILLGNTQYDSPASIQQVATNVLTTTWGGTAIGGYCYIDNVSVVPVDSLVFIPNRDTICYGNNYTIHGGLASSSADVTYSWVSSPVDSSLLSQDSLRNVTVHPNQPTQYILTATDTIYGCTYTDTFNLFVTPAISAAVNGPAFKCDTFAVYSAGAVSSNAVCFWSTSDGSSFAGQGTSSVSFDWTNTLQQPTWIYLSITDTVFGCSYMDSIRVSACCQVKDTSLNFYNDTMTNVSISNQDFTINGTLTINGTCTWFSDNVQLGSNAKIIIGPGDSLIIRSNPSQIVPSHLYACDAMWDGIYVSSSTANPGVLVLLNGTTVEDAKNAIVSSNGGVYLIDGTTKGRIVFNKNYKAIVVNNFATNHPGKIVAATIDCIDSRTPFTYTGQGLRWPKLGQNSLYGMEIKSQKLIYVGRDGQQVRVDSINRMRIGIRATESATIVKNVVFTEMVTDGTVTKGDCETGTAVCASGSPAGPSSKQIRIGGATAFAPCKFVNVDFGVEAWNNIKVWMRYDTLMSGIRAVNMFGNSRDSLYLSNNYIYDYMNGVISTNNTGSPSTSQYSRVQIINNVFNLKDSMYPAIAVRATEVSQNPYTRYQISRNVITRVRNGIVGTGLMKPQIIRNGIAIWHSTDPRKPNYGIRLTNSSLGIINGNDVLGRNSTDWWVDGISLDLCYSDQVSCNEVNTIGNGFFFGGIQTPNTQIVQNVMQDNYKGIVLNYGIVGPQFTSCTAASCLNDSLPNDNQWYGTFNDHTFSYYSNGALSPFYVRPYNGNLTYPYYPGGISFMINTAVPNPADQIVFNEISPGTNTYNCPAAATVIPPYSVEHLIGQIVGDSIETDEFPEESGAMLDQSLYLTALYDSTFLQTYPYLTSYVQAKSQTNLGRLENVSAKSQDKGLTPAQVAALVIQNAIAPSNLVELNTKQVNGILLGYSDSLGFSGADLQTLRGIAAQCPYEGGTAVFRARAALQLVDTTDYTNACEYRLPGGSSNLRLAPQSSDQPVREYSFSLYPNPNDGNMVLEYDIDQTDKAAFELFDVTGRKIHRLALYGNATLANISATSVDAGVYYYRIVVNGKTVQTDKVVIIH